MKRLMTIICKLCLSACSGGGDGGSTTGSGKFSLKTPFPEHIAFPEQVSIREVVSFSIGSKGYLAIPKLIGASGPGEFWEFDSSLSSWSRKNDHPGITFESPVFVVNSKAIAISGNTVWEYDPASDHWTQKNNAPGADKRASFAFAIGNYGYVGGGFYNGKNLWRYNADSDSWTQLTDHPVLGYGYNDPSYAAIGGITFVLGSKGYVTGTNMYFWEYNPAGDTWIKKTSVNAVYGQTFTISDKGYVFNAQGEVNEYDQTSDSWSLKATLIDQKMCYPATFSFDGVAFLGVGGLMDNNTCTLDVTSNFWSYQSN